MKRVKSEFRIPISMRGPPSTAARNWGWLLLASLGLLFPPERGRADSITLFLSEPEYGGCGNASVNGSVSTSEGTIERVQWVWGDGTTNDSWFPALHYYQTNGSYLIQATAFSSTSESRTETVTAHISNAHETNCTFVSLYLAQPAYLDSGAVMVNGTASATVGQVEHLVWDWGDGATNETWFPATHTYSSNGMYEILVTAYASVGQPLTETVTAVVTNAQGTNASVITLMLSTPEVLCCGEISINGFVSANAGVVERLDWDWGDGTASQSFFPAQHSYVSNGNYTISVTAHGTVGLPRSEQQMVTVNSIEPACANTFRVYPPTVFLKNGKTNQQLTIDLRDPNGRPIPVGPGSASFQCETPSLVQVTADGMVSATGRGTAVIEVSVQGQPRTVNVVVVAGELRVEPPIWLLSMDTPTNGLVVLKAFNADGSLQNLTGHSVVFSGGNDVASVDAQGVVIPLRPPTLFYETPYVSATLDTVPACNACVVRVTETNLNLAMSDYVGEFITVRVPNQIGPYPYDALMTNLQVSTVLDALYRMEHWFCGTRPSAGGQQFLVLDPGPDEDGTVPCGLSGNPIRIGVGVDNLRSCFSGLDWIHWGVMAHELAHDFLYQASFLDFGSGLSNSGVYTEGLATAVGAFSVQELMQHPDRFGLCSNTVASLHGLYLPLTPDQIRNVHYEALTNYEANPNYAADFSADLLDAILFKLSDEYGSSFFFRLMSVFYPDDEIFLGYQNETQRLTFWVAACSAAAQADLRARFRDTWGYPVDDAFFADILPRLQQRASQRDPLFKEWSVVSNEVHFTTHAIPDTEYQLECSPDLITWTSVHTNIATEFTLEWAEPFELGSAGCFFRVRQP